MDSSGTPSLSESVEQNIMMSSWFFNENFNGVSDDFFDVIKFCDFPLENFEGNNINIGESLIDFPLENFERNNNVGEPLSDVVAYGCGNFCNGAQETMKICCVPNDETSQLKQMPNAAKDTSGRSICPLTYSSYTKGPRPFETSSPISVLESSSSCSVGNPAPFDPKFVIPVKRARRKRRRRPSTFNPWLLIPLIFPSSSTSERPRPSAASGPTPELDNFTETSLHEKVSDPVKRKQKKKKNLSLLSGAIETEKFPSQQPVATRKCMHCKVTKTPQWREGPMGPKTLCNACGVRYRSGRLYPEYRPAASPTFIESLHSNSHKKVIEMRNKGSEGPTLAAMDTLTSLPPESSYGWLIV